MTNKPMDEMGVELPQEVDVVGAVIRDSEGRILCALRSDNMSTPGVWEFPGGKIEAGETPEQTLRREIREELHCEISVGSLLQDVRHPTPHQEIRLRTYEARVIQGDPSPRDHACLLWLPVVYLHSLLWAPADIPTVKRLQREQLPTDID